MEESRRGRFAAGMTDGMALLNHWKKVNVLADHLSSTQTRETVSCEEPSMAHTVVMSLYITVK
jgi:hypothetical protein